MSWIIMVALAALASASDPHSSAAVLQADEAWEKAEVAGDTAFLNDLLLPGYVSVGVDGKITTRESIIARAGSRSALERRKLAAAVASWRSAHPVVGEVTIAGDTAILRWVLPGNPGLVSSSDIFAFKAGRWHALYSQHSGASK